MPTRVIASFTSDVQKNCAWAISLHFVNTDGSDFDLSAGTLTGQVRSAPANDSTVYADMTMTITSATGGVAVAALSAKETGSLPATGQTFAQKTPVWVEIDFVPTADPTNPICLGQGLLQVSPGGNAVQSTGSAPTVPLETINLTVGAVSAPAARQLIGINGPDGKVPAVQLPLATATSPGAMSAADKAQALATPDRVRTWIPMGTVFEGLGQYTPGEPNLMYDTDPQILVGYRSVFKVWFSQIFDGYGACIGYAESPDGEHWTRWPQLVVIGSYFRAGHVIRHTDGYYYMTALATGGDDLGKINLLRSADGVSSWTKVSTVSSPEDDSWKSELNNSCLMIEADKWSVWYSTVNASTGKYVVGLATSTDLGATWTDDPACPVLSGALSGPNVGGTICGPFVQKVGTRYIMWAHTSPSKGMSPTDLQRFESTDRTTWTQSVSGFTIPRYNPASNPHVTDVDGQVADITMCEANGRTYAIVVALSDSTYESHFDLFTSDKTIAELVATSEGIVTGAKPDMITNGSFEKTGAYGAWGSCGAWTDVTTTGTVARTTTAAEVRPDTSRLAAMKITAGAGKNSSSSQDIWGLTAGAAYTLSGWSCGDGGSYGGRIAIRDSSANDLATSTVPTSTTYGRFSVAFTAPSDGRCSVVLRCPDNSGSYVCFDDLSLVATAEVGDPQRPAVEVTAEVSAGAGRVRCSTMAIVAVATLDLTLKDQAGQSLTIPANRGVVIDATTYITAGQYSYLRLNGEMATGKLRGYLNSASAIEDRTRYFVLGIANGGAVAQIRIGPANAAGYRSILMTSQNGGQAGINLHWGSVAAGAITSVGIDGGGGNVLLAGTQITALME